MNELLHFSEKPLTRVDSEVQGSEIDSKPVGLWVSVGEAWAEWCLAESYNTGALRCVTRVVLSDSARVLRIATLREFDAFDKRFARVPAYLSGSRSRYVDWGMVATEYDGIIIAPYLYDRRFSSTWYYGWDVASGCIWNADAIASIETLELTRSGARQGDSA